MEDHKELLPFQKVLHIHHCLIWYLRNSILSDASRLSANKILLLQHFESFPSPPNSFASFLLKLIVTSLQMQLLSHDLDANCLTVLYVNPANISIVTLICIRFVNILHDIYNNLANSYTLLKSFHICLPRCTESA